MTQYEIRTKDLKTVLMPLPGHTETEARYVYGKEASDDVLVLHAWETDAEADKARVDFLSQENHAALIQKHGQWYLYDEHKSGSVPGFRSLRKCIDEARSAPQATVQIIATPEGVA